jgi:hypothetical protein
MALLPVEPHQVPGAGLVETDDAHVARFRKGDVEVEGSLRHRVE